MEFTATPTAAHRETIANQPVFFVATVAAEGRISLSSKRLDSFRVLDRVPTRAPDLYIGGD